MWGEISHHTLMLCEMCKFNDEYKTHKPSFLHHYKCCSNYERGSIDGKKDVDCVYSLLGNTEWK